MLKGQNNKGSTISASFDKKSLEIILIELKIDDHIIFEYQQKDIEGIKVSAFFKRKSIREAMTLILKGTGLGFDITDSNHVVIRKLTELELRPWLQNKSVMATRRKFTLSGTIKDKETGETLPYASLQVQGTSIGVSTNVDGWFTLFNVPSDTSLIEIQYLGYQANYFRLRPGEKTENIVIKLQATGHQLAEVTITAAQEEQMMRASSGISKIAISPAQIADLPSLGEKDIFRSLQLLPGVSGSNESSSGLYVRGGTPDQNLVLFDGFTVYHVDHLFGFFSAFNANAIKDVQLYKGGFEAKYGGRLSSVVDITGKDGNSKQFNAGASASLLSANAFTEVPFAKGKGTILLAGRRSFQSSFYNNLLEFSDGDDQTTTEETEETPSASPFGRGTASVEPNSWFYDLNGKATFRHKKDVFSLSFYSGKDHLDNSRYADDNSFGGRPGAAEVDLNFTMDILDLSNWGNTGESLKWSRRWNDKLYSNALVSRSNYFSHRDRGIHTIINRDTITTEINAGTIEDNNLLDYSFKWDWEWQPKSNHQVRFGVFGTLNDIKYDFIQNDTINVLARDEQGITTGLYLSDQININDKLIISPGIRTSYFTPTNKVYFEPRLSMIYLPTDKIKLKAATGRYYQFANRIIREDISQGSRDFWVLSDGESIPVSHADHFIAGISYETKNYLFDVEAYYKSLDNITEYSTRFVLNGFGPSTSLDYEENFFNGTGIAKGLEFLIQKKTGKYTGWISYTLGSVKHQFDIYGEDSFFASHDATNELKIVNSYRLGKWSFTGTFVFATGKPYTSPVGAYSISLLDGESVDHFAVSDKNAFRLPDYHRLDLSVNYHFDRILGGKGSIGASIFNAYGRKNIWYKEFEVIEGNILETDVNLLGFTPSLFFSWTLR